MIVQPTFCPFLIRYIFVLCVIHLLHVRLLTVLYLLLVRYVCVPYDFREYLHRLPSPDKQFSILLTSCLTAIKNHVIKYCTTVYKRNGKNLFWSIKNSGEILNKLKSRGFLASGLSTYDFSTLYTTLPHNLIKEKLAEFIEQTFNREGSLYLA